MLTITCALVAMLTDVTLHVSPSGHDTNPGTTAKPLKTFEGAKLAARRFHGKEVVVEFSSGTYRLDQTVVFSKEDSGNITYRPSPSAHVVLTGSVSFQPTWTVYKGPILKCKVPAGFDTDQLFINGEQQILARYPNADPTIRILQGYARDAISPERVAKWKDPTGGFFHVMHPDMWGDFHFRILGKDAKGGLNMEGGWQNNRRGGLHQEYRFVEGIFEELDAPGEWFLDAKARDLYYYPRPGTDLKNCFVEGPRIKTLVEFRGAHGIKLTGFTFQHTLRTFMDNREPLLRSDWTIYRGGAIHFLDSHDCEITNSTLQNLGGNAVFVDGRNRRLAIRECVIKNVGANGVAFVGDPKAVRSPLFEYNERQTYAQMDKTPGPKTDDYPMECLVEDCLITRTGGVERQSAPVEISMSRRITVRHCSIYHVPRAGINIGDGCWGGHLIEGCDVFDTVLETGDHGSFNSWGRDRYWGLTDQDMNLGRRPDLAQLDMIEPTVLRNNRWRCDHGWDIDLDDGSSKYVIENNLCLNGGIKNREGFGRVVQNNVIVNNSFHPHVWFANSQDVFRRNIVFSRYFPIGVAKPWGREVDFNFLHAPGLIGISPASVLAAQSGRDEHSLTGDAEFVDPMHGDFRVRDQSPALGLGFVNFDMSQFGVRLPALKAMALEPPLGGRVAGAAPTRETLWVGAHLKDLIDLGDISAAGLGAGKGVFVANVDAGSPAAKMGLEPLDVIEAVDGTPVTTVQQFLGFVQARRSREFRLWRHQTTKMLVLP